jgi:hypothetical protein
MCLKIFPKRRLISDSRLRRFLARPSYLWRTRMTPAAGVLPERGQPGFSSANSQATDGCFSKIS